MSLKAKIEAVIYASEEPVTLAQLVGLLGEEGQVELDRAESVQQSLSLDEPGQDVDTAAAPETGIAAPEQADADQVTAPAESPEAGVEATPSEGATEASESSASAEPAAVEDEAPAETAEAAEPDAAAVAKAEKARAAKLRA